MNSELSEAYYGVYCSSKEILKNNQRHLFCNMLDLLTNTCKTTGINCNKISNNDQVQFWISNILPLLFDVDSSIQSSAVSALEQGLVGLDINSIHKSTDWTELKNKIIITYAPQLNKLRDDKNIYWHRIWCLLIQILDREILKGASTINSFLSIVELGFRSPDNKIRAEAFLCWRLLIKIFSAYDELSSPKRMKLICIPLKSSQSKTAHAAEVKLRVWWYLFSCLGQQLEKFFESVVEPFLQFCFGVSDRNTATAVQQFSTVRQLAFPCIAVLISTEYNGFLSRLLKDNKLELISQPSPLFSKSVISKYWRPVATNVFEGIRLLNYGDGTLPGTDQQILNLLIRYTTILSISYEIIPYRTYNCLELAKMLPDHTRPVISWFNTFAVEGHVTSFSYNDVDAYVPVLNAFLQLFHSAKSFIPPAILQRCVDHAFKLPENGKDSCKWTEISKILDVIVTANDEIDYEAFEVRVLVWRRVSINIQNYLRENTLDYRIKDCSSIINNWIIWPLKTCVSFAGRQSNINFDNSFLDIWRELVNAGQNCGERSKFLSALKIALSELLFAHKEYASVPEFLQIYANAVLKFGVQKNLTLYAELFHLFNETISLPLPVKFLEMCLNIFINVLNKFSNSDLTLIFDSIKTITTNVVRCANKNEVGATCFEDWKRAMLEKIKNHSNKSFLTQIKELFKGNDIFVIIPSVWSLNPEKLTDRQKERFAEKADIPALYNDMSQSQEASIKPWTPKKIVIAKEDQTEIVIRRNDSKEMEFKNTESADYNLNHVFDNGSSEKVHKHNATTNKREISVKKQSKLLSPTTNESKGYSFRSRCSSTSDEIPTITSDEDRNENISQRTRRLGYRRKPLDSSKQMEVILPSSDKEKSCAISPIKEKTDLSTEELSKGNKNVNANLLPETEANSPNHNQMTKSVEEQAIEQNNEIFTGIDMITGQTQSNTVRPTHTLNFQPAECNIESKEVSPKKTNQTRFTPLFSPPDRRLINNNSSPTLRPKPSTHLTGRGAQLINMIRNKKLDSSSYYLSSSASRPIIQSGKEEKKSENHTTELPELTGIDHSTPILTKDLLIFSKRLPSPTASPSASILKRKFRRDSIDDQPNESPAFKRKRVSFHDPPVSVTKEYIRDAEDNKFKPKRCLIPEKNAACHFAETKYALKRRSKLDSIEEIEKYDIEQSNHNENECEVSLKWNESRNNTIEHNSSYLDPVSEVSTKKDIDAALTTVIQHFSIESILDKYFSSENIQLIKSSTFLTKFLSNQMTTNQKIKASVLEILSENHSKDFLDHAVQENLSSVVCDRLNLNSVIDYVCAKSKINAVCRNNLLSQVPELLKNSKMDSEKLSYIKTVMEDSLFSDDNILELITLLMKMRAISQNTKADCVSESAVDSSSNL